MLRALQGVERPGVREFMRRYLLPTLRQPKLVASLQPQYLCQLATTLGNQTGRHRNLQPNMADADLTDSSGTISSEEEDEDTSGNVQAMDPQPSYFEDDSEDDYRAWLSKALNDVWCAVAKAIPTVAPRLTFADACELSVSLGRARHYDPIALGALLAKPQQAVAALHRIQHDLEQARPANRE
jgi:hypothetical protein